MKADIKVKKLEEDCALSCIRVDTMVLKQILNRGCVDHVIIYDNNAEYGSCKILYEYYLSTTGSTNDSLKNWPINRGTSNNYPF